MAMLVSHSLTFCFVGLDLFCCTPGDTLFFSVTPPTSSPFVWLEAQGQGGEERSICKISEVIVTKVAELRLLQSLAGLKPALICHLILRLTHSVYYEAMTFTALRLQPWYNMCCDFKCCCNILFHLDNVLKEIRSKHDYVTVNYQWVNITNNIFHKQC